jgi:hypothetical protein
LFQESLNVTDNNYLYTSKRTALQKVALYVYNNIIPALQKTAMCVFLTTFSQNIVPGTVPKICKFFSIVIQLLAESFEI